MYLNPNFYIYIPSIETINLAIYTNRVMLFRIDCLFEVGGLEFIGKRKLVYKEQFKTGFVRL